MTIDIKPCPYCRCSPAIIINKYDGFTEIRCSVDSISVGQLNRENAIRMWNEWADRH